MGVNLAVHSRLTWQRLVQVTFIHGRSYFRHSKKGVPGESQA